MSLGEIDEIKSRLDIVDLIGQYVALKKAGANYKGVCPFHQEKTPSMMVSPQKQIWKCFGCGKGGDQFAFVMEAEHLEFGDALRLLAQRAGVTLQPRTATEHQTQGRKERLYRINSLVARIWQKLLQATPAGSGALAYLKKRGLTNETIKKFGLGLAPRNFDLKKALATYEIIPSELARAGSPEKFFDRIMFPIYDVLGNVIAFTGRALGDPPTGGTPKYLNSPETPTFNKSRTIYGLNFAKAGIKERDYVVLVEGQMDVIALHQAGATNAVASSGTAITETQIQTLSKYTQNFLLAFDGDAAGRATTKKVIELLLRLDLNSKVADFGQFKDAGELLEKEPSSWPKIVAAAKEGVEWWLNQEMVAVGDTQFIENKKKITKAMLPVLGIISDETRLDHYVSRLAQAVEAKTDSIYASLEKYQERTLDQPTGSSTTAAAVSLTDEEQLLAMLLNRPGLLAKLPTGLDEVVWQSAEAARIAEAVKTCYDDKTLANNPPRFLASVKTHLDSQLAEKIDSWLFWLSTTWPDFNEALGAELVGEKMSRLGTKKYERQKEQLATKIRLAQEAGDTKKVLQLMTELSELTKLGAKK